MLSYEEMPSRSEDLAKLHVSFPHLPDDTANSCPVPIADILDYLALEVPDGEDLRPDDLRFIRTAVVAERRFWIWAFTDLSGVEWYLTVSVGDDANAELLSDENEYGLSPEQFMLGVYYHMF